MPDTCTLSESRREFSAPPLAGGRSFSRHYHLFFRAGPDLFALMLMSSCSCWFGFSFLGASGSPLHSF